MNQDEYNRKMVELEDGIKNLQGEIEELKKVEVSDDYLYLEKWMVMQDIDAWIGKEIEFKIFGGGCNGRLCGVRPNKEGWAIIETINNNDTYYHMSHIRIKKKNVPEYVVGREYMAFDEPHVLVSKVIHFGTLYGVLRPIRNLGRFGLCFFLLSSLITPDYVKIHKV